MRKWLAAALTAAVVAGGAKAATRILTMQGMGPVHLGMTPKQVEKALGAKFKPMEDFQSADCWQTSRADNVDADISYMIEQGRITRIDIWRAKEGDRPDIASAEGIGIGSTEDQIKKAYGAKLKIELHPYEGEGGRYMSVMATDKKSGMLFETSHGKVVSFRIGVGSSLGYSEGCE